MFSSTSYKTDSRLKKLLGHVSYFLTAAKQPFEQKPFKIRIETEDAILEEKVVVFLIFNDIKFIDESPEFYTPEEFMDEFKLNEYYIEFQTEGCFKDVNLDINSFETNEELFIYLKDRYVEAKTYEICK